MAKVCPQCDAVSEMAEAAFCAECGRPFPASAGTTDGSGIGQTDRLAGPAGSVPAEPTRAERPASALQREQRNLAGGDLQQAGRDFQPVYNTQTAAGPPQPLDLPGRDTLRTLDSANSGAGSVRPDDAPTSSGIGAGSVSHAAQRNLAGRDLQQAGRDFQPVYNIIQTVAEPTTHICFVCKKRRNEDDCFVCPRCGSWACQNCKDPHTLLCRICARIEASQDGAARGTAPAGVSGQAAGGGVPRPARAAHPPTPATGPAVISTVAKLSVRSDPPGAEVLVDARSVGQTPLEYAVDLGILRQRQVEVVLRKDGHQSQAAVLQLQRGQLSQWHGVVLPRVAASDLPDPTAVHVQEILVAPLEVEVQPCSAPVADVAGLPPMTPEMLDAVGLVAGLRRTIAALQDGTHPSLQKAQAAVREAHDQHQRLNRDLDEHGRGVPSYVRKRLFDEAARDPSGSISQLAALAPRVPAESLLKLLYTLRHSQHAQRVAEQAQGSYDRARQAKVAELQQQLEALTAELLPQLEADFAEIVLGLLEQSPPASGFPLEAWLTVEPLLAQRPYPWDARTRLAKAEELHRSWPDHRDWRQARESGTVEAIQRYLAAWPQGQHADQARAWLAQSARIAREQDERHWQERQPRGTAEAYSEYLAAHPCGRHAAAARALLASAQRHTQSQEVRRLVEQSRQAWDAGQRAQAFALVAQALGEPRHRRCPELLDFCRQLEHCGSRTGLARAWLGRVLGGHTDRVLAVQFTSDGEHVISAGQDKKVLLWDPSTGSCEGALEGHRGAVCCLALHPDGRRLISGSRDFTLRVWDLETRKCLRQLAGHQDSVLGVCVSEDGRLVVSASSDGTIRVWDLSADICPRILKGRPGNANAVAFDPCDGTLWSAGQDGSLRAWDLDSGACRKSLSSGSEPLNHLALSPDAQWIATAGNDKTVRLWGRDDQCARVLSGHESRVLRVRFGADGQRLISAGRDKTLRLWDVSTGRLLKTFAGHEDEVSDVSLSWDGHHAVSCSHDQTVRRWNLENDQCQATLGPACGEPVALAVSRDGQAMVVAGADRKLRCTQARVPAGLRLVAAHQAPLRCVDVSHDGQQAVSVAGDRVARIWELETGRCVQTLEPAPDDVLAACFAPDGRSVWVGCRDGTVARADLGSQELRRIIEHPEATLRCLTLCPEAGLAVGGTEQGSVLFWDLAKGKSKGRASLGSTPPAYVALSRDGQRLVIAGDGQQLLLVHLQTRTIGKSQGTHSGPVSALALSADGTWLVSGGLDGTVMLWDFATGQCLTKLDGHSGPVRALALGSDNAWFASGGVDGVIRIWELLWDLHF